MAQPGQEIVNPRTGQRMTFLQTASSTKGALLRIETTNPPGGAAEPEHVHPEQESSAEVLEGALHFRVDGKIRVVQAGEKIVIPANSPHTFWNQGGLEARSIQELRPALRSEEFFEMYFALACDGRLDEKGMPPLLQLAVTVPMFGREARPTSPPWPVLRVICWLLAPLARARGYRAMYPFRPTAENCLARPLSNS